MIESSVIEWLDFGDSIQKIDTYSKANYLISFSMSRQLIKNKESEAIDIILIIISFLQLLCITSYFIDQENDIIIKILKYLKNIFLVSNLISIDSKYYTQLFIANNIIIYSNLLLYFIILFLFKKININFLSYLFNLINTIIHYYYIGPAIEICLTTFFCENGNNILLSIKCSSNLSHKLYSIFFSAISCFLFIFSSVFTSIFSNEIGTISINSNEKLTRINCNYEVFNLINKIIIFSFYSIIKLKKNNNIMKLIFIGIIFVLNISIFIYIYKFVYYYYNKVNNIIFIGWIFNCWFCLCIFLKAIFNIKNISTSIIIGWVFLIILLYKLNQINEYLMITERNFLEFKNIKSIEIYNNVLLKTLTNKNDVDSKILLYGNIKIFEEYLNNNPEINYHYQKLLKNNFLNKKYNNELHLKILSIIYIIYTIQVEKSPYKDEIALYMSYFLINKLNNPNFAIYLCSKINARGMKLLYYKYLLAEEIKEKLIYKLIKVNRRNKIKNSLIMFKLDV